MALKEKKYQNKLIDLNFYKKFTTLLMVILYLSIIVIVQIIIFNLKLNEIKFDLRFSLLFLIFPVIIYLIANTSLSYLNISKQDPVDQQTSWHSDLSQIENNDKDISCGTDINEKKETVLAAAGSHKINNLTNETEAINANIDKDKFLTSIEKDFERLIVSNQTQINKLHHSGDLNLVYGALPTVAAICLLVVDIFRDYKIEDTLVDIAKHYLPRASFLILLEVVAFFFFRFYKASHMDTKYYHNEMANHQSKLIALKIALYKNIEPGINECIMNLIKTERNFILKKDESTIDLEREKIEAISGKGIIEKID